MSGRLTPAQQECLDHTVSHFREIARSNRFAENSKVAHDTGRCVVCNPGILPVEPFAVYLEVIAESVKVRRPCLDGDLVAEMNGDRRMEGFPADLTIEGLLRGEKDAADSWAGWVCEALATGLGLLSVHSPASLDFDLDEEEARGAGELIERTMREIMEFQKVNALR